MAVLDFAHRLINRVLLIDPDPQPNDPEAEGDEYAGDGAADARGRTPAETTGRIHVMRHSRSDYASMPLVLARPRNMEDATSVADRVKDRVPIVMNLEGVDEAMSRRIVDFIGGVVFALDGSLRKTGRSVYVCSPVDIPIEELRGLPQPARRVMQYDFGADEPAQAVGM